MCAHAGSARGQLQLPDSSHKRVPACGWPRWGTSTHTTHCAAETGTTKHSSARGSPQRTTVKDHAQPGHAHAATATEGRAAAAETEVPGAGYGGVYTTTHSFGHSPARTRNRQSFPQVSHTSGPWLNRRVGGTCAVGLPEGDAARGPKRGCGPAGSRPTARTRPTAVCQRAVCDQDWLWLIPPH